MQKHVVQFATPGLNPSESDYELAEEILNQLTHITCEFVKAEWMKLAPQIAQNGWLIPAFYFSLEIVCKTIVRIRKLEEFLDLNEWTYESETRNGTQIKMRPEVGQLNELHRRYNSYAGSFGLVPSAFKLLKNADLNAGGAKKQLDLSEVVFGAMNQGLYEEETYSATLN